VDYVDTTVKGECLFVVEGNDDEHVIGHVLAKSRIHEVRFKQMQGVESLVQSIPALLQEPREGPLGIVVDANGSATRSWKRIRAKFCAAKRQLPDRPDPRGTIVSGDRRRSGANRPDVGVWIMPDNQSEGELEDFVRKMIPAEDKLWPKAKAYISRITEAERRFALKKTMRAQVHAWLAATKSPRPMGLAVKEGDLVVDGELCRRFVDWVVRLQQVYRNGLSRD